MANVYDMNHILMPSLGSFPRAWRKDIDTSRPQNFATGLQSHRMSQRCINIINIINFKLFERAMIAAMYQCLNVPVLWCLKCFPTATCTWSWTSFKSLASLERSMALPRFAVFDMYAFWSAWRRTCHCKSDRHYLIENSRRILLQQDKRQGSFIRRHNIRWTMQTETIVPNSPMTGWEATLCPCRSLQCNAVQV